MIESKKLRQGRIVIGHSDAQLSIGNLHLTPGKALERHNRPFNEQLMQVIGSSVIVLFEGDALLKEVILKPGDVINIPGMMDHMHTNPYHRDSVTMWKFEGDITQIIEQIRRSP